jgi:hypothetical protein
VALLRRIDHPHVVRLRRVVDLPGGGRALVLDHAAGGSLSALVGCRGPLDAAEACTVVVPLARTLAELHERGLVHGDLTPSNVLFTTDGRPLITDLGSARIMGESVGEVWGSDGYLDPAGNERPAPTNDVYGLGAVLRFVLTGDPVAPEGGDPRGTSPAASGQGGSMRGAAAESMPGDSRLNALLALADLCTAPDPARRPDLLSVARIALAATPPAPVRLLPAQSPGQAAMPPAGSPIEPVADPSAGLSAAGLSADGASGVPADQSRQFRGAHAAPADAVTPRAAESSPRSRPVVVRIDARLRRPRSAADAGWTRPPPKRAERISADASTGALVVPRTQHDLQFSPVLGADTRSGSGPASRSSSGRAARSAGPPAGCSPVSTAAPGSGSDSAATRLRSPVTAPGAVTGQPRRRDVRRRAPAPSRRIPPRGRQGWLIPGGVVLVAAAWWAISGNARPAAVSRPAPDRTAIRSARGAAPVSVASPALSREPVGTALRRLAQGRAEAFREVSEAALTRVDEPGSEALAADRALVARLRAAGVRLEGLTFAVTDIHPEEVSRGVLTVQATISTSAHRRVSPDGARPLAGIAAAAPRLVVLQLVPAPDGLHWLVRQARGQG